MGALGRPAAASPLPVDGSGAGASSGDRGLLDRAASDPPPARCPRRRHVRRVLLRLISLAVRTLPAERRAWGRALEAEAAHIRSVRELARWSAGLLRLVLLARVESRRIQLGAVACAAVLVALVAFLAHGASVETGRTAAPVRLPPGQVVIAPATPRSPAIIGRAADGTPYGPTIHRLRDLTASLLECDYAHGARRQALGGSGTSFIVRGTTASGRTACAPIQAATERIQHTQAYADDAAATAMLVQQALRCVQAQGIALSGPGVTVAERTCKQRLELQQHVVEPAPLP
jgi:hypothetical protein